MRTLHRSLLLGSRTFKDGTNPHFHCTSLLPAKCHMMQLNEQDDACTTEALRDRLWVHTTTEPSILRNSIREKLLCYLISPCTLVTALGPTMRSPTMLRQSYSRFVPTSLVLSQARVCPVVCGRAIGDQSLWFIHTALIRPDEIVTW